MVVGHKGHATDHAAGHVTRPQALMQPMLQPMLWVIGPYILVIGPFRRQQGPAVGCCAMLYTMEPLLQAMEPWF